MKITKYLAGGAAYRATYQVASTVIKEIPLLVGVAEAAGLASSSAGGAADMVGINFDAATFVTAQQTDGSTAERTVTVDIRPDAVIKARLSGTTATGGAIVTGVVTTNTTTALTVIASATDFTNPSTDEGGLFFIDGVNTRQYRKIITEANGTATVKVAFEKDHQAGDRFFTTPFFPMDVGSDTVTLTTELDEVRQQAAITASGAELQPISVILRDLAGDGLNKSYVLLVAGNHVLTNSSG